MPAPTPRSPARPSRSSPRSPDAVITGGSGTPGALPYLALAERGYKGGLYGTHALINPDFVRVGGAAGRRRDRADRTGDRRRAVARQQPHQEGFADVPRRLSEGQQRADHRRVLGLFVRRLAGLRRRRQARACEGATGHAGIPRGVQGRLLTTKEVVGTHGVYNFKPGSFFGVDERARVLVQLRRDNGSCCSSAATTLSTTALSLDDTGDRPPPGAGRNLHRRHLRAGRARARADLPGRRASSSCRSATSSAMPRSPSPRCSSSSTPGTVWLVLTLAALATAMEVYDARPPRRDCDGCRKALLLLRRAAGGPGGTRLACRRATICRCGSASCSRLRSCFRSRRCSTGSRSSRSPTPRSSCC